MPMNGSGPISLGGSTAGQSINLEIGSSATAQVSLNDTNVRSLAGVPSGVIVMPTDFYGKTFPFPGGNASYTDLATMGAAMYSASNVGPTSGGTLTINGVSLGSYDYTIKSGSTTVSSFTNGDWFTTTQDTRSACIAVRGNLTINGGVLFKPSNRKLFTFIYVAGNLTMNGEISMTDMAANASGTGNSSGGTTSGNILIYSGTHGGVSNPQIPSNGGSGAAGQSSGCPGSPSNPAGSAGSAGGTGGGGGGGSCGPGGGSGATGSAFAGGGGGGSVNNSGASIPGGNAVYNGGRGGDSSSQTIVGGGGGAGQPGGSAVGSASNGGTGCAGVIIIICTGTISGSGTFSSVGQVGGDGGHASGGAGGGGSINIMYGTNSSSYTLNASGGPWNTNNPYGRNGGAGGAGTARLIAI